MAGAVVFILITLLAAVTLYRRSAGGSAALVAELSRALSTEVELESDAGGQFVRIGPLNVPDPVVLRGRMLGDSADQPGAVSTGDEPFDRWIAADGDELTVVAWLDERRRRTLRSRLGPGETLEHRYLRLKLDPPDGILERATQLFEELGRAHRVPLDALCETAANDPSDGAQAKALELLAQYYPDARQATQIARVARDATSSAVRAAAALYLAGVDGPEALRDLALDQLADVEHRRFGFRRLLEAHQGQFAPEISAAWAKSSELALRTIAEGWVGGGLSVAEPAGAGMLSETKDQGAVSVFELDYSEEQQS